MIQLIQRFFSNPFRHRARQQALASQKLPMAQLQQALRDAVHDCSDEHAKRVRYKIDKAQTPSELWALRSDMHQCFARFHSERVAMARINDVAMLFTGWIPASQLTRIQPGFRASGK